MRSLIHFHRYLTIILQLKTKLSLSGSPFLHQTILYCYSATRSFTCGLLHDHQANNWLY